MVKIEDIKFDDKGLVPAIVVDADTGQVLTLAYMNEESLRISLEKKLTCFWSRSRQELWLKRETSGNYQHIVSITADCDRDALVVKVKPDGPACHLGTWSCFDYPLLEGENEEEFSYEGLMELIRGRKTEGKEGNFIARVDPRTNSRGGDTISVGFDVNRLHFFFITFTDSFIVGNHQGRFHPQSLQRLGQRAHDVGQTAGFDKRSGLRCYK